jgi:hypothetical protein
MWLACLSRGFVVKWFLAFGLLFPLRAKETASRCSFDGGVDDGVEEAAVIYHAGEMASSMRM